MDVSHEIRTYLKHKGITITGVAEHFNSSPANIYRMIGRDALTPLLAILNLGGDDLIIKCKDGTLISLQGKINQATDIRGTKPDDPRKNYGAVKDKIKKIKTE